MKSRTISIILAAVLAFLLPQLAQAQIAASNPLEWVALAEGNELINGQIDKQIKGQTQTAVLQNSIAAEFNRIHQWEKEYNNYLKTASGFASSLKACTHLYNDGVRIFLTLGKLGKAIKNNPQGIIASMSMNENVILEKNENYWDAENVSLQKVTFRYVLDQATALTAYESGEVDGVASIPSSDFARLKAENAGVQTSPSYGTVYYDFNCSAEPVNNVLVRKAICLAIDRQSIIDNVVQVDAQPAYSFLAPGYSVDGKDITEGRESFGLSATADVEGAQAALAEAGYPNGEGFPTLTLSYYDNDTVKKVVEAMAEMLKNNLNINVEVSSNEWSIFYDDVQKGNYQVAAMGWSADYVNPMSFLPLCKTGDSSNNLFYSNADYDALVDQVKAENDPAKAAELTLQADAIVSNDYAVLPLYYKSNNYLMHDNISGFYMTASGNLFFKDVKVG